jgi:hypothetical protein
MSDLGASFTREYEQKLLDYEQRMKQLEIRVMKLTGENMHAQALAMNGIDLHYADYDLLVKLRQDLAYLRAETRTELKDTKDLLINHMQEMQEIQAFKQKTQEDIKRLKQDIVRQNTNAARPRGVAEPATSSIPLYSFPEP